MKANIADNKLSVVTSIASMEAKETVAAETPQELVNTHGVVIGHLVGLENMRPIVFFSGCPAGKSLVAQTTVTLTPDKVGKSVLIAFENQNPERPIIIGLIVEPEEESKLTTPVNMQIDGERVLLTAEREIVLRCGEASLTLTRAGKVIIKGAYVLSRSSGYNKIKGAAIDIN